MEALFTIFYLSGQIKSLLNFYSINLSIDFVIISLFLIVFGIFIQYRDGKISLKYDKTFVVSLSLLILFYIWLLFSLTYTPSPKYSQIKSLYFSLNIFAFVLPFAIKNFNIPKFVRYITVSTIFLAIIFIVLFINNYYKGYKYQNYDHIAGLYLNCSTLLGINVMILATTRKLIFRNQFVQIFLLLFSFVLMIIMGARGPIFFSVGLLLVYFSYRLFVQFIITKKLRFWNLLISIISAILVLGILYFIFNDEINFLIKRSLMRLNLILNASDSQNMGKSVDVRLNQVDISLSLIFDNFFNFFFGYGIGSFGILEKGFDHRSYPHNILLEIWVELGFIGVIIFGSFVVKIFLKNIKFKNYIHYFVLLFLLLNSMKSSSIIDIRNYFIIFSLYILNSNRIIFSSYNNTN